MMNEQPFVDVTLMSLVHVTDTEINPRTGQSLGTDQPLLPSTSLGNTAKNPVGQQSRVKETRFDSTLDLMVGEMDKLLAVIHEIESDPGLEKQGLPVIERNISLVSSDPPPTWSMLQEAEVMKSCNPVITPSDRKSNKQKEPAKPLPPPPPPIPTRKAFLAEKKAVLGPTPLSLAKQTTTLESFKPRPTLLNPSGRGQPFVMTLGPGKEPSSVGMDDTMKSLSELKLELENRRQWEKKGASPSGV